MSKTTFEKVTHDIDINEFFVKSNEKVYLHWTNNLIRDLELTLDCKKGPKALYIVGDATSVVLTNLFGSSDVKIYKAVNEADNNISTLIVAKNGSNLWIISPSRIVLKDRLHAVFNDWWSNLEKVYMYDVDFSEATDTRSIFAGCYHTQEVSLVNCIFDNDADISDMFDEFSGGSKLCNVQLDIKFAHEGDARIRMDNLVPFSDEHKCKLKITGIERKDLAESDMPIVWADTELSTPGEELISTSDPKLKQYIVERLKKDISVAKLRYEVMRVRTKDYEALNKADEIKIFAGLLAPLDKYDYLSHTIERLKILLRVAAIKVEDQNNSLSQRLERIYYRILNQVAELRERNKTAFGYTPDELADITPQHEAYKFISLLPGYYKLGWNVFGPDNYVDGRIDIRCGCNISDASLMAPNLDSAMEASLGFFNNPYGNIIGAWDDYESEVMRDMNKLLSRGDTGGLIQILKDNTQSTADILMDYKYGMPRCAYHRYMAYISPMIDFFDFNESNTMSFCALMTRTIKVLERMPGVNMAALTNIGNELNGRVLPIAKTLSKFDAAIENFVCSFGGVSIKELNQYRARRYATGKKKETALSIGASTVDESARSKCTYCYGEIINGKCVACGRFWEVLKMQ